MERMDLGKRMRSLERRYRLKQRERSNSALENGNKSQERYSNGVEHDVLGSSLLFMNQDVLTSYEKAGEFDNLPAFFVHIIRIIRTIISILFKQTYLLTKKQNYHEKNISSIVCSHAFNGRLRTEDQGK